MLAVDAGDNCFVSNAEGGVGGVFLDVDNGAGEDHLLDLVAGNDVCRGSGGDGSCEGSKNRESGRDDSRLHFDVWFGLVFGLDGLGLKAEARGYCEN